MQADIPPCWYQERASIRRQGSSPYSAFCFLQFQSPMFNCGPNIVNEEFQKKQLIRFKLCSILGSVMKSHTSTWDVDHSFVRCVHAACLPACRSATHLPDGPSPHGGACAQVTLILLNNGSKPLTQLLLQYLVIVVLFYY